MSDNNGLINVIPKSIDNAVSNITDKPTLTIGNILDDLLFLVFGDFHQDIEKRRIKHNQGLIKFESDVKEEMSKIPPEKQINPQTRLVLSALEASQYCVEEENLRKMFARLISNSMNSDYTNYVHPSFVTIVKEMSSLDAENISLFKNRNDFPIANYIIIASNGDCSTKYSNVFLANTNKLNINEQGVSISILEKLGLVQVTYQKYLSNEKYDIFEQTQEFITLKNELEFYNNLPKEDCIALKPRLKPELQEQFNFMYNARLEVENGMVSLTEIGKQFVKICT